MTEILNLAKLSVSMSTLIHCLETRSIHMNQGSEKCSGHWHYQRLSQNDKASCGKKSWIWLNFFCTDQSHTCNNTFLVEHCISAVHVKVTKGKIVHSAVMSCKILSNFYKPPYHVLASNKLSRHVM